MDQATLLAPVIPAHPSMLPLLLAAAIVAIGSLLALGSWVRKLGTKLASQEQKIQQLENRLRPALPEAPRQPRTATGEKSRERYKVLYLNSLGYSAPEIAKETRLRAAEVNFILRVDAQAATVKSL